MGEECSMHGKMRTAFYWRDLGVNGITLKKDQTNRNGRWCGRDYSDKE